MPAVEHIYLSEMLDGGAFAWLQHNVALNAALSLRAVQAIPCDWAWFAASGDIGEQGEGSGDTAGEEAAHAASDHVIAQARSIVQSTSFDLVIGSDLVYEEEGMRALVRVFAVLAARGVRLLPNPSRSRSRSPNSSPNPHPHPRPNPNPSPNANQACGSSTRTRATYNSQDLPISPYISLYLPVTP